MQSVGGEGDQTPHISPHTLTAPTENPDYAAADIQDGKDRLPDTTDGPSGHQLIRANHKAKYIQRSPAVQYRTDRQQRPGSTSEP